MKVRRFLILTAIVSSILGAVAAYLALTVPNDLKADAMLKVARTNIERGEHDAGREELTRIVQQYPRTDAAAAATVALVKLADQERRELDAAVIAVRDENTRQAQALARLQQALGTLKATPPPAPPPPDVKQAPKQGRLRRTPRRAG